MKWCWWVALAAGSLSAQSFSIQALDRTAKPCDDFYQFSCGTWLKTNPVPAERSVWGRFHELDDRNQKTLYNILETASANRPGRDPLDQKIGDFFASCMDEEGIEKQGTASIRPDLERIQGLKAKTEMTLMVTRLHRIGAGAFFRFASEPDLDNAEKIIAGVDQGGLGLPERDYYLRTDAKSVELRRAYLEHLAKNFELLGDSAAVAAQKASAVLKIETQLAEGSLDVVARRDPEKVHHPYQVAELISLNPGFDWTRYFEAFGQPGLRQLNVAYPPFFRRFEEVIVRSSLDDLKAYLTWSLLRETVGILPKAFVDENFRFYGKTLEGRDQIRPRWKRCVDLTDQLLGEALGQRFVEKAFPQQAKAKMQLMVKQIQGAMARDIAQLDWMSPETKKQALAKLRVVIDKIGYPAKWREYNVEVRRGDLYGNATRLSELAYLRDLGKIGTKLDKTEWQMTPPTVNAYFEPSQNTINFPAGILQPPFFDPNQDDAVNYGAIGGVIGHEITHGFDDQGRKFDAEGNLKDWWTEKDGEEFEKRTDCFVKQYYDYIAVGDVKLNGKLTLGENVADAGGLRIAYLALTDHLRGKVRRQLDGFTPEQRFFLGWAQIWCSNLTEQAARLRANVDPHSPGKYRVNGVVSNMPEFQRAFGCQVGDAMVRRPACRVW
jgi:endothelin-converting enzyme/putative endopeptidase